MNLYILATIAATVVGGFIGSALAGQSSVGEGAAVGASSTFAVCVFLRLYLRRHREEEKASLVGTGEEGIAQAVISLVEQDLADMAAGKTIERRLIPHHAIKRDVILRAFAMDFSKLSQSMQNLNREHYESQVAEIKRWGADELDRMLGVMTRERTDLPELERSVRSEKSLYSMVTPLFIASPSDSHTPPTYTAPVIDHAKYLHLLDEQSVAGFPSVMRARKHFSERLESVIPVLRKDRAAAGQKDFENQVSDMRQFMLEKVSSELAFLCAMSFFERMCGSEFRHTPQCLSLVSHMEQIEFDQTDGLTLRAVTSEDLDEVVKIIDAQRERQADERKKWSADNVTIAICALRLLMASGVPPDKDNVGPNSEFTRMTIGAMNIMRQTFAH
jgi:hypothetical protein